MKRLCALMLVISVLLSVPARFASADERIDEENQRLEDAERQEEIGQEGFDEQAKPNHENVVESNESKDTYSGLTPEELQQLFEVIGTRNGIRIYINDVVVYFNDSDVPPQIIDGRTMVPVRIISEHLGADVEYKEIDYKDTVIITKDSLTIRLTIGENVVFVNGKRILLDVPAMLIEDRTMVPFRFLFEQFGMEIEYQEPTEDNPVSIIRARSGI